MIKSEKSILYPQVAACFKPMGWCASLVFLVIFQINISGCSSWQQLARFSGLTMGIDTVLIWKPVALIKKEMFNSYFDTTLWEPGRATISKTIAKVLARKTDKTVLVDFDTSSQAVNPALISDLMKTLKAGDCKPTCPEVDSLLSAYPTSSVLVFSFWKGVERTPTRQFFSDLLGFSLMIPTFSISKSLTWNSSSDLYIAMVKGSSKNVIYFNYQKDDFDPRSMDILEDETEVVLHKLKI